MISTAIHRIKSAVSIVVLKIKYKSSISFSSLPSLGKGTEIISVNQGRIRCGRIITSSNVRLSCVNGEMRIGNCFINRNCIFVCHRKIEIGDGCEFGPNVVIYDHDHFFDKNGVLGKEYKYGEVIIEKNCWIGAGAIILKGTHVGEGSVIGAGTIVNGVIPPHSVVVTDRKLKIKPIV